MSSKVTGPLFKQFGSKWLSSKTLPPPEHDTIVEPFAGGAGYSLRHSQRKVCLTETDENLVVLWLWLISEATSTSIRDIPVNLPEGTDIRTIGLSLGQQTLLKHWQRTNNVGNCWTTSPWGNKPGQWTENTRARVADESGAVKHWLLWVDPWRPIEATWFIDPPYQYNYKYRQSPIDYEVLATRCRSLKGQIIACEAACPKTGKMPDYLPFQPWASRITSRRKVDNNHHSKELLWTARQ